MVWFSIEDKQWPGRNNKHRAGQGRTSQDIEILFIARLYCLGSHSFYRTIYIEMLKHWLIQTKIKYFPNAVKIKQSRDCPWPLIDSELKSVPFNLFIFFHPLVTIESPGVLHVFECQSNLTITSPHITFNILATSLKHRTAFRKLFTCCRLNLHKPGKLLTN